MAPNTPQNDTSWTITAEEDIQPTLARPTVNGKRTFAHVLSDRSSWFGRKHGTGFGGKRKSLRTKK